MVEKAVADAKKVTLKVEAVPTDPIRHKGNPTPPLLMVEFSHLTQAQKLAVAPPFFQPEGAARTDRWYEGSDDYRVHATFTDIPSAERFITTSLEKLGLDNLVAMEGITQTGDAGKTVIEGVSAYVAAQMLNPPAPQPKIAAR